MPRKTKTVTKPATMSAKVDLLVTMFNDLNGKISRQNKMIEDNRSDIQELKKSMNMGKGGIKGIMIFGALIGSVVALFKFFTSQQ